MVGCSLYAIDVVTPPRDQWDCGEHQQGKRGFGDGGEVAAAGELVGFSLQIGIGGFSQVVIDVADGVDRTQRAAHVQHVDIEHFCIDVERVGGAYNEFSPGE